ncbi:MAG TPA: hypothetical protein PLO51_02410 [Candidatus Micrarchaeota archaeon]|nr:hypothetical protein [Candidatus Micrarchaeota archaeon]
MGVDKLSMNVKKIIPWATGAAVYISKEAKINGWKCGDYVIISAFKDEKGEGIEIRKANINK